MEASLVMQSSEYVAAGSLFDIAPIVCRYFVICPGFIMWFHLSSQVHNQPTDYPTTKDSSFVCKLYMYIYQSPICCSCSSPYGYGYVLIALCY